ncbi:MAG: hypothetical protein Q9177_006062 [Variospora cf. flavescens]
MGLSRFFLLALLSLRTLAEDVSPLSLSPISKSLINDSLSNQPPESPSQSPALSVQISTSFPSSEIFGVKLINAVPTLAVLSITNNEPSPINVVFIGGSLWTVPDTPSSPPTPQIVRNLTTTRYNDVSIPAGEKESVEYRFKTELQPQDLLLNLAVVVTDEKGEAFTIPAFNETVAVVERDTSIFDPQIATPYPPTFPLIPSQLTPLPPTPPPRSIFLYLFLLALFAGTIYFIYSTWIATLFPQSASGKKRGGGSGGKDASRARASTKGNRKVDPADQMGVAGTDGAPAVVAASGAKAAGATAAAYDESWIPEGHLQRPGAKRVKSAAAGGTGRKRA